MVFSEAGAGTSLKSIKKRRMREKTNLLIINGNSSIFNVLKSAGIQDYCRTYFCGKQDNIFELLKNRRIKLVIIDSEEQDNIWECKLLKLIKTFDPEIEIIIVGNPVNSDKVIDWINLGASDYLMKPLQPVNSDKVIDRINLGASDYWMKPLQPDSIQFILNRINEKRRIKRKTYLLERKLEKKYIFHEMVGKSPFMLEIFSMIERISKYFSTVLITGDTGTGKEMVAKAIHRLCPVKNKSFVVKNCASVPENLFESELFGYVKGAFTGADKNKKGLFEEAHEGIIFLDEIAEIPVSIQAKLLRVLETHQFRPLGSNQKRRINVRVIASTNKDLREEIKNGNFREDLFHRLNKIEIHIPPLKNRSVDIPLLVRYFIDKYNRKFEKKVKGVSREVQKLFLIYDWPGNVRELENAIERALMLCEKEFIHIIDLPKHLQQYIASTNKIPFINKDNLYTLQNMEKEYITYLLNKNDKNIRKTAKILDISRSTLYEKLEKYSIPR